MANNYEDIDEDFYQPVLASTEMNDVTVYYNNMPAPTAQHSTGGADNAVYYNAYDNVQYAIGEQADRRQSVFGNFYYSATGSQSVGPWRPKSLRGISLYPPEAIPELNAEDFVKDPWQIIEEYNTSPSDERRHVLKQFFLHSALPYMETRLENNNHSSPEVLKILPHVTSFENDSHVNRYSLHLILDVLSKTRYDLDENVKGFILECETLIRYSIFGENPEGTAVFDTQTPDDQGLRVFVYSRVLMMLVALFKQRQIAIAVWNGNEELVENLYRKLYSLKDETPFKEKRRPRYAIACIRQARETLKLPNKQSLSTEFLRLLHEHYKNDVDDLKGKEKRDEDIKQFLKKIRSKENGWFDFHIAVSCLAPQIQENPKMISVLRIMVEYYSKKREYALGHALLNKVKVTKCQWSEEALWQTGLLLGDVLENVVMSNKDDAARKEASACLCIYVEGLKDSKNSTEKLFVEQSLQRCCCGPSKSTRPMMLQILKSRKEEPITPKSSMDFLQSSRYKKEMSPSTFQFIGKDTSKALYKAHFRGEESLVKIWLILSGKQYEDLLMEAYFLRRLNSCQHPNILRVFGYDTSAEPYHLITEYVYNQLTLLQYLQRTRSDTHNMPNPSSLIQMAIGIVDALIYINNQHLVHLAITSDNVLVGKNRVCKITGFQALREMAYNEETHDFEYHSQHDEISMRHSASEVMIDGRYTEKSMVFSMGYLLFENHTYGITPYNWLTNDETDKIRSHVIKGGRLPEESCIPQLINDIITQCHRQDPQTRPDLVSLKAMLQVTHDMLENTDADTPSAELPPLSEQDWTHSPLSSCVALDNVERSKDLGFFGSPTKANDIAKRQNIRGIPQIRELVEKTKEEDLKKIKGLVHANIVNVLLISDYSGKDMALMTEESEQGNLLSLVLAKRCSSIEIVRLLVQALSGLVYMHDSNILHCDICAEHLMVFYGKNQGLMVKIARLGRSTYLKTSPMEREMPEDSFRRNPPEVIKNNIYSCSSDVWQFCIMCYELYIAQGKDEGCKPEDVHPFCSIQQLQILGYLEDTNNRPPKPTCMPEWLHIAVKQGLLHKPEERPPFVLLKDCLTYRKPFESCLLTRWKEFHPDLIKRDKIDVEAMQPSMVNDHVIPSEEHLTFDDLKQLTPVAVFMEHSYKYHAGNQNPEPREEEDDIYECPEACEKFGEVLYDDIGNYEPREIEEDIYEAYEKDEDLYDDMENYDVVQERRLLPPSPPSEPRRPLPPSPPSEPRRPLPSSPPSEPRRPLPPSPPSEPRRPLPPSPPSEPRRPLPPSPPHEPHATPMPKLVRPPQPLPRKRLCHDESRCSQTTMVKTPIKETNGDSNLASSSNNSCTSTTSTTGSLKSSEKNFRVRSNACGSKSSLPTLRDDAHQHHLDASESTDMENDSQHDEPHYENLSWLKETTNVISNNLASEQSWHSWESLPDN